MHQPLRNVLPVATLTGDCGDSHKIPFGQIGDVQREGRRAG